MPRKAFPLSLCLFFTVNLGGCGTADHYSPRAEIMNRETATAKSNQILTNILRAAYREPLQFTDTSTISGTASVTASIGSNLPVAGVVGTGQQLFNITPGGSVSEGPTFNIANLNTQEFYQGLQTPIELGPIAGYQGSSKDFGNLLSLATSDVEFNTARAHMIVHNTFKRKASYTYFRSLIDNLIRGGLAIETVSSEQKVGPELNKKQAADPDLLGNVARAYGQAASSDSVPLLAPAKDSHGKDKANFFQFVKNGKKLRFCFLNRKSDNLSHIDVDILSKSGTLTPRTIHLGYSPTGPRALFDDNISETNYCGRNKNSGDEKNQSVHHVTDKLSLHTRSVEQMIYFLGDMVRTELALDPENKADLNVATSDDQAVQLFQIREGAGNEGDIRARYHGRDFYVANDPTGLDTSTEVIQLLTELIALQSSAKSYPTPNLIAISAP